MTRAAPLRRLALLAVLAGAGSVVARAHGADPSPPGASDPAPSLCPSTMLLVPGGTFGMGSETTFPDEAPVHPVTVQTYCLDRTEVTVAAYRRCVAEERCTPPGRRAAWPELFPSEETSWSSYCNGSAVGRDDHPINCVDWQQAETYCRAHGGRLPTEEEFEYAARGGDEQRTFPWGEEPPDETLLNACGEECAREVRAIRGSWNPLHPGIDGWAGTAPVGTFPKGMGRWGHLDLSGNVWEWMSDVYCPYGSPDCFNDERSVRGSGFLQASMTKARATRRNQDAGWHMSGDSGFRCATSLGENPPPRSAAIAHTLEHYLPGSPAWIGLLVVSMTLVGMAGWVLGMLGGGGSVLTVPILLFVVGLEQMTAVWMGLVIMSATAAVSALSHARAGRVELQVALLFGLAGIAGAFGGGRLAQLVPPPVLLVAFIAVMLVSAWSMLKRRRSRPAPSSPSAPRTAVARLGLLGSGGLVGLLSGFIGVGGGFMIVPALTLFGELSMPVAVGTSSLIITMNSLAGLIGQLADRGLMIPIDWRLALSLSLASAVGTFLGSRRTDRIAPERLRRWFGVLILSAAVIVLVRRGLPEILSLLRSRSSVPASQLGTHG
jgi:uncharacterized membrane protein YfcA/formylglycine-generating enzyme required for sulfatase activity